ncbi:MAG: tRNA dihydrouridine synthase DusB [Gammaproteobacteria bacterium]|jgi:tRNA-dihydrouridine synthase B
MQIGPYKLRNRLVLAPMAGVTDRPFRQLCKKLGAALAVSEMVSSNSALWGSRQSLRRMDHAGEIEPRSIQIAGADPAMMAAAARFNVERGAQIIDINMGCPAKKVCNQMAGSALLRDEGLVRRILDSVVAAVDVPVTLKIRTGWDAEHRNAVSVARLAEQAGVQALAIHGRTRACGFKGGVEYETIGHVKRAVSIPVIANGDITGPETARRVLESTGADAVMIGRAAQGRPWIFREIEQYLATGELPSDPPAEETRTIMIAHLENLYSFYGTCTGVRVARKHIGWYSRGYRQGAAFRQSVNRAESVDEQLRLTHAFFDRLCETQGMAA